MKRIRAVALDVDGVLTDGSFYWNATADELKRFCFRDIMGLSLGMKAGIIFVLVSGEDSPIIDRFARKMSIVDVYKGCKDKASVLRTFAGKRGLDLAEICFMGDDVNDLGAMELAGFSAAPADAHEMARESAKFVTKLSGGNGAVRELIDFLLSDRNEENNSK